MQTTTRNGVTLAYEREGREDAQTVVFVEGLGYGRWMWHWQREAFVDDYDLLLPDNRGTGDSSTPEGPYTISEMAGDLETVLDDAGVESAHVVGASMGGMIAMQYALEYDRTDSLTLLCTSPGGKDAIPIPEATQEQMFVVPEEYDDRESIRHKMAPAMSPTFPEENPDVIERIVDWRLESDASDRARQWQAAAVEAFDVSDRLEEITVPALVLHGTADRVVPVGNGELLAERLPDARFEPVPDAPHLLFIEAAETVNDHLATFLDDV